MSQEVAPWNNTVLYQVYPWSFKEDEERQPQRGNGSIRGITEELPYLIDLGVDAIWISPPYPGPMKDAGYDISNFTDIHPDLGTLEDFDELVARCHENGVRVMLDFIPNHTSDQHEWFQKSRDREPGFEDWYIWHPGKKDEQGDLILGQDDRPLVPNNWASVFSKPNKQARLRGEMPWLRDDEWTPPISAWQWDDTRQEYYLRTFAKEQPDLNWGNERVVEAMLDNVRFWLDRGVDGFRMDAINHMAKDYTFPDDPINTAYSEDRNDNPYEQRVVTYSGNYMPEFRKQIRLFCDVLREEKYIGRHPRLILESYADESILREINGIDPEIATTFNFGAFRMPWDATMRKLQMDYYYKNIHEKGLANQVNGNHDNPRLATRLGGAAARAAAVMNLFLPGMRIIYNGEELGLHDATIPQNRMQDPNGLRDGARTPIIRDDTKPNAGFSMAAEEDLWLPINKNDLELAATRQRCDSKSSWALYKAAIRLCHNVPVLREGKYVPADTDNPDVLAFVRSTGSDHAFVLTNFSDEMQPVRVPQSLSLAYRAILSSIDVEEDLQQDIYLHDQSLKLRPNELIIAVPA